LSKSLSGFDDAVGMPETAVAKRPSVAKRTDTLMAGFVDRL